MLRWTQDRDVPRLKYEPARDPKGRGWHYQWEGAGFGVQLFATGRRKWIQCGHKSIPETGATRPYFFALGDVDTTKLADARCAAGRVRADAKEGIDPREQRAHAREAQAERSSLADTTLRAALDYYLENRNCAPSSKTVLASCLEKNLSDWMTRPILAIDATLLQSRYRKTLARVRAAGERLDAEFAQLPPEIQLTRAPAGYRTGIKTAHDVVEGFGRVYTYWTTKHMGKLQQAGIVVPQCPTAALLDDVLPQPQRVKSVPIDDLRTLWRSFATYDGNALHPLLARFLLASGLRVGVVVSCRREYVKTDRIVIPPDAHRGKVRWNKRHLDHMAKIVPLTPEIDSILREIERAAPRYGDAETWLFPTRTSKSGHMEEERCANTGLRQHANVRFTFHQLRHNVASAAEELGYSKAEIAELLGHSTGDVTDRYIDERVQRHHAHLVAITKYIGQQLKRKMVTARRAERRRATLRSRISATRWRDRAKSASAENNPTASSDGSSHGDAR